jgi:hypothetical protein
VLVCCNVGLNCFLSHPSKFTNNHYDFKNNIFTLDSPDTESTVTLSPSQKNNISYEIQHGQHSDWLLAGRLRVRSLVLVEARIFSSPCHPEQFWGPPSLLSNRYQGPFPQGRSGRGMKFDHSPPTSTKVKCRWIYTSLPHMSSWHSA